MFGAVRSQSITDELITLFWSRVRKTPECWMWQGAFNHKGYGRFQKRQAHRIAYELMIAPIARGLTLDHLCRNRGCVNPAHLEPVTNKVNVLRGVGHTAINSRKTHCSNGHELTPDNLLKSHYRRCKTCDHMYHKQYDHRERKFSRLRDGVEGYTMEQVKVVRKSSYQGVPQWGISTSAEITPSKKTAEKWAQLENAARCKGSK